MSTLCIFAAASEAVAVLSLLALLFVGDAPSTKRARDVLFWSLMALLFLSTGTCAAEDRICEAAACQGGE